MLTILILRPAPLSILIPNLKTLADWNKWNTLHLNERATTLLTKLNGDVPLPGLPATERVSHHGICPEPAETKGAMRFAMPMARFLGAWHA